MDRRERTLAIVVVSITTLITLVACEFALRIALFSDIAPVSSLRQPWRYADSAIDENYWKLLAIFDVDSVRTGMETDPAGRLHPEFGWAPETTRQNPLGLIANEDYALSDINNPIPFYGDSFVAGSGAARMSYRIPQLLDQKLPDRSVLNYGVGGYGIDQVFLRFSATIDAYAGPLVLVGILTDDVDRSIFGIRVGQKPYFRVVDDELELRNLPILPDPRQYVAQNPPQIRSYLFRLIMFKLRPVLPRTLFEWMFGYGDIHQNNLAVNRRILQEFARLSDERDLDLACIIFYSREEILEPANWRETFLKESLENLNIPYFDTKDLLADHLEREALVPNDLYYEFNNHLNELGNVIVADGLYLWLLENRLLP